MIKSNLTIYNTQIETISSLGSNVKKIYAPWRSPYIKKDHDQTLSDSGCVFCDAAKSNTDEKHHILLRGKDSFVITNKYPYSAGHVLVVPYEHHADLSDLTSEQRGEMMELANLSAEVLKKELNAQGINMGLNLGEVAGAGIPGHVHMHVLPRWKHDSNFMPLIAETKVISTDLDEIYKILKKRFSAHK